MVHLHPQHLLCTMVGSVLLLLHNNMTSGETSYLSVNFWKLNKAIVSKERQDWPTTSKASSVTFMHFNWSEFNLGQPSAMAVTPAVRILSDSKFSFSRIRQFAPTDCKATSVTLAHDAIPSDFRVLPHPSATATIPSSPKPSQNFRLSSSKCFDDSPTARNPQSPT